MEAAATLNSSIETLPKSVGLSQAIVTTTMVSKTPTTTPSENLGHHHRRNPFSLDLQFRENITALPYAGLCLTKPSLRIGRVRL